MENFWDRVIAVLRRGWQGSGLSGRQGHGQSTEGLRHRRERPRRERTGLRPADPRPGREEGRARPSPSATRGAALEHRRVEVDSGSKPGSAIARERSSSVLPVSAPREQILIQRESETSIRQQELDVSRVGPFPNSSGSPESMPRPPRTNFWHRLSMGPPRRHDSGGDLEVKAGKADRRARESWPRPPALALPRLSPNRPCQS